MIEDLATAVKRGLKTRIIGGRIVYLTSVTSTMDAAREEALKGAAEGTVIIAGEQTAGRGRLKRQWLAPEGNISLSIVLRPDARSLPYLIMIASVAVVRSIKRISGVEGQIKWPNDVLIGGRKVCGILIENEMRGSNVAYSVAGIGVNVGLNVDDYSEIARTATSLEADRIELTKALLEEFDALYGLLPDVKAIYEDWRNNLVTLGKRVKATWGEQSIEGVAEDVDEDGALVIRGVDGRLTKVVAGDVTLRDNGE